MTQLTAYLAGGSGSSGAPVAATPDATPPAGEQGPAEPAPADTSIPGNVADAQPAQAATTLAYASAEPTAPLAAVHTTGRSDAVSRRFLSWVIASGAMAWLSKPHASTAYTAGHNGNQRRDQARRRQFQSRAWPRPSATTSRRR